MAEATYSKAVNTSPYYSIQLRRFAASALVMLLAVLFTLAYLLPFGNMVLVALQSSEQLSTTASGPVLPMEPVTFSYQGKDCLLYNVPLESGTKTLAMIKPGRQTSDFIDPANPEAGVISWKGNWRGLEQITVL